LLVNRCIIELRRYLDFTRLTRIMSSKALVAGATGGRESVGIVGALQGKAI
jgi:hypothetical protein